MHDAIKERHDVSAALQQGSDLTGVHAAEVGVFNPAVARCHNAVWKLQQNSVCPGGNCRLCTLTQSNVHEGQPIRRGRQ